MAIGAAEHPKQQALLAQPELEQPLAKLLPERRTADVDPLPLKDLAHRGPQRPPLARFKFPDPLQARLAAGVVFIELDLVRHSRQPSQGREWSHGSVLGDSAQRWSPD